MNARVLIAAIASNSGKTTLTLALLSAFRKRGLELSSFKQGPDYLDPQLHREMLGISSYNLDSIFLDRAALRAHLADKSKELSIVEGAMGFYDGVGDESRGSSYELAKWTDTPVILVIDAKSQGQSLAAIVHGFKTYREDSNIQGVIFNRTNAMRYPELKRLCESSGVSVYGYFPEEERIRIASQYLGLTIPEKELQIETIQELGRIAEEYLDVEGILRLAQMAPALGAKKMELPKSSSFKVGIARDQAFSFLYQENIECLLELGAEIVYFSPLLDRCIDPNIDALYLPGGYPEQYAQALSENVSMRSSLRAKLDEGLPCIAEGGGFLYLHECLENYPMLGSVPAEAKRTEKIQGFGYHELEIEKKALIGIKGRKIPSRRYHYCKSSNAGSDYLAKRISSGRVSESGYAGERLYASFFTLYFPTIPEEMLVFRDKALEYQAEKKEKIDEE